MKRHLICSIFFLSTSCIALTADKQQRTPETAACGPAEVKLKVDLEKGQHVLREPARDTALLYIVQQPQQAVFPNCGIITRYAVDGSWVGANCSKSYFGIVITPGEHHLCGERQTKLAFHGQSVSLRTLQVEAGKTYFLRAVVNVQSSASSSIDLQDVDKDEVKLLIAGSELSHLKN